MTKNLFVGGLPYETKQEELEKLFAPCGTVSSVKLIMDGLSGRCKGFGFVEMSTEAEAQAAMAKLNGLPMGDRKLFISEARPEERRPAGAFPVKPGSSERRPPSREARPQEKRPGSQPGQPGFVERRSGVKDRRRQPFAPSGEGPKRESFDGAKKWRNGPGGFGGNKKPWERPAGDGEKRRDFSDKRKPWGKPAGGAAKRDFGAKKKWGAPRSRPGGRDSRRPS